MNPVLYVLINGELKMSPGKAAAQAVHAAMMLEDNYKGSFASKHRRTVIVLEAKSAEQIKNLHEYLKGADVFSAYYTDEGVNEVDAYSVTALAVEPLKEDDYEKREMFSAFSLFGGDKQEDNFSNWTGWGEAPKRKWYETRKHYSRRCDRLNRLRIG